MSEAARQLSNLPLSELIGGPLAAMVEAEALAAQTTADYIEQIGFVPKEAAAGGEAPGGQAGEDAALGRLRMARFNYTKLDAEGRPAPFEVEVPVLSLVPIPGIRIKSGKFAFTARIVDIDPPEEPDDTDKPGPPRLALRKFSRLRGGISPRPAPRDTSAGSARGRFEIDIEIEVEQMPIAPGLDKLLNTFDQAILDGRAPTTDK